MIGARLAMMNAVILVPYERRRSMLFDRFEDMFDLGHDRTDLRCVRIRDYAAQDRDALDQFGDALYEEHGKSDHDQRFGRPLRQSAGITRLLVETVRAEEERYSGHDHDHGQRQQE